MEIKCPIEENHWKFIKTGTIPLEYEAQMNGQLSVTGRRWVDYVSFDPRFDKDLRLRIKRFERNDAVIRGIEAEIIQFLREVEDECRVPSEVRANVVVMVGH